jgi:hypothetical protein
MRDLWQWRLIVPVLLIGVMGGVIVALLLGMRSQPDRSLPGIVAQWSPIVSVLTCNFRDRNGGVVGQQNGSGILTRHEDGSYYVITNEHVFDLAGCRERGSHVGGRISQDAQSKCVRLQAPNMRYSARVVTLNCRVLNDSVVVLIPQNTPSARPHIRARNPLPGLEGDV